MEWLVWIIVVIAAILWFAGRDAPASDSPSTSRRGRQSPPERPAAQRPPAARDLRREREGEAFADGAVFGWFAYHQWFADNVIDPDDELSGEGLYDDEFDDGLDDGLHDDGWDELDDGFGF